MRPISPQKLSVLHAESLQEEDGMNVRRMLALGFVGSTLCLGATIGGRSLAADRTNGSSDHQIEQLQNRIDKLEARVAQLEKRPSLAAVLAPSQTPGEVPKDWVPRTFNGLQYYIVPLDGSPKMDVGPSK